MCKYVIIKSAKVAGGYICVECDVVLNGKVIESFEESSETWSRLLKKILDDDGDISNIVNLTNKEISDKLTKRFGVVTDIKKVCTGIQVKTEVFNKKVIVHNVTGMPLVFIINTERALLNILADNPSAKKITILDMA